MDVGKAIKELRINRGLSQRDLAKQIGLTNAALWKIENGKTVPRFSTIENICSYFRIPLAYFYARSMTLDDFSCHEEDII